MPVDTAVIVIGAGLAGLSCASRLHGSGVDVLLLEAADAVGGRVRTDQIAHALPIVEPSWKPEPGWRVNAAPGVYICGDHQENPSIQGAMASGRRVAVQLVERIG